VFRYAPEKVVKYLKVKVARLDTSALFEQSNTLIRALAKDGLMEDGKDKLLECQLSFLPT
jgi:ribonuclease H2 subunit B